MSLVRVQSPGPLHMYTSPFPILVRTCGSQTQLHPRGLSTAASIIPLVHSLILPIEFHFFVKDVKEFLHQVSAQPLRTILRSSESQCVEAMTLPARALKPPAQPFG